MTIGFATERDVLAALAGASSVTLSAYTLAPDGAMARALTAAADRGARIDVTLASFAPGGPSGDLERRTAAVAAELRAHGARVRLGVPDGDAVHLKAAIVDGTAYLDDRNWSAAGETIVVDRQPGHVAAIRAAIDGRTAGAPGLATEKAPALALEAAAIRCGTGDAVDLASESFGACTISAELRARAAAGAHVRLLVDARIASEPGAARERAVLRGLAAAGVDVRTSACAEKFCVAGDRGWVGSANATFDAHPTTDWGLRVDDPALVATLERTFARAWAGARPFAPARA